MTGLTQDMIEKMLRYVEYAREKAKTIFIIEHNLSVIMNTCEIVYVLDQGVNIANGTPMEVQKNPRVIESYLGET